MRPKLLLEKFFRKNKKFIFSSFLIGFFLIGFLGVDFFFKVKEIQIEGADQLSLTGITNLAGKNLLFINKEEIEEKIRINNSQVKKISLVKIYPQKLKLIVTQYQPQALLLGSNFYFYLSEDGRVLFKRKKQDQSLPVIYYYQKFNDYSYQVGDWITFKDLITALEMLTILNDLGLTPQRIDISGEDMILFKIEEKVIFLSSRKDKEILKYQLTKIIKQFKIEGKEFKTLDLRFDKPIIKF